jgi:hypothetical protein
MLLSKLFFQRETEEPIGAEKELDDADDIGTKSKQEENHFKVLYVFIFLLF